MFGGGIAVRDGKVIVAGGGEAFYLAATDRVLVIDVEKLPPPEPCFFFAEQVGT